MNRRKKIKQLLKAHAKKASAKLAPQNKSKYISKADRLKLAAESSHDSIISSETIAERVPGNK
ncbi:hypothetical protein ABIA48_004854 [Pseudomonas sp. S30_BP2TU TE3576]|jgi:hypothetical protein|uniref:Uncharacterized protein n=1 Tax=Pseudomonas synxantha TaxID=47883 RepID=A0ACC6JRF4_9PSED|nr:DUF2986 domain-containing protein [Pseudomonas synxantha]MDR6608866.1 hypothetical protein [Pseudomonas synxantha]